MAKRIPTRGIRRGRSYTYQELAELTGRTIQTIRRMVARGLRAMTEGRPHLILGADFIEFVESNRRSHKVELGPDQLYCFRCRVAVRPLWMVVDYAPVATNRGRITGFCEHCERECNKLVSRADLSQLSEIFEIGGDIGHAP